MKVFANFIQKNGGDPTSEWLAIRRAKLTASEFHRFVKLDGTLRKGEMAETYLCEKLFERWTGRDKPGGWLSMDVNNGIIIEEKAALFAEMEYGFSVQPVGFVSDDAERYGCSPDGLVGWTGLKTDSPTEYPTGIKAGCSGIEIKAPALATHIKYLLNEELPEDYVGQVQGSMAIAGCQTWHFLSYPLECYRHGFPPLHLIVERDETFCENLHFSLAKFLAKYDAAFDRLCEKNGGLPNRAQPAEKFEPEPQPPRPDEKPDIGH